jgi:hypothetical protein
MAGSDFFSHCSRKNPKPKKEGFGAFKVLINPQGKTAGPSPHHMIWFVYLNPPPTPLGTFHTETHSTIGQIVEISTFIFC